jgi:hypothetical protein
VADDLDYSPSMCSKLDRNIEVKELGEGLGMKMNDVIREIITDTRC